MSSDQLASPYKFLDSYGLEDREIFFGRERETRILLSDIVVARLVVLFAKTGTGKTSLINAGVRPLLEERGYTTFVVRVATDPLESARAELFENGDAGDVSGGSLMSELTELSRRLGRSVVIFFDQFEEFFLQTARNDPDGAQRFISSVAELYEAEHSHVHIVFSMREDYFVDMDAFREEIPTIFHNDSNLRLRWFDRGQARAAITQPAAAHGVELEDALVEHLLADLSHDGTVEPAQLQILCDTLWRSWVDQLPRRRPRRLRITADDYVALGRDDSGPSVAQQVLARRLQQQFEQLKTREELELLARLLPYLRTEENTKQPRDLESLTGLLGADPAELAQLLDRLGEAHLLRVSPFRETVFVELSHDYLAQQIATVSKDVEAIWPRRELRRVLAKRGTLDREIVDVVLRREPPLVRDAREAELVLRSALATNADAVRAIEVARGAGADARAVLRQAIEGRNADTASAAVRALGAPGADEWLDLLERALRKPALAFAAADALVGVGSEGAVAVLARALSERGLADYASRALGTISTLHGDDAVGDAARRALRTAAHAGVDERAPVPPVERPRRPARNPRTSAVDDRHLSIVASLLADGEVIPFLGAGANLCDRPAGAGWESGRFPPSGVELARTLAERSRYPDPDDVNLLRVSQYVDAVLGESQLYRYLHAVLDADYPPTSLHRMLARLPRLLRDGGRRQLVVLTTNQDDILERALEEQGEPYDVVWYEAKRGPLQGRFLHRPPGGDVVPIQRPNKYTGLALKERPVVLKLLGSVDRSDFQRDSYVVTEDDYLDYLTGDIGEQIPFELVARMADSHFVFLAYSMRDWNQRGLLRRIWGTQQLELMSWAIQPEPATGSAYEINEFLWRGPGEVDLVSSDLGQYVAALERALDSAAR